MTVARWLRGLGVRDTLKSAIGPRRKAELTFERSYKLQTRIGDDYVRY